MAYLEKIQHMLLKLTSLIMVLISLAIIVFVTVSVAYSVTINKCVIDGRTVYTEAECPNNTAQDLKLKNIVSMPEQEISEGSSAQGTYSKNIWYEDYRGYQKALRESKKYNAPIFIYGHTDWCGYCRQFEKKLLAKSKVKGTLKSFVKVKINPEHSAKDKALFKKLGGKGYPSLLIQEEASGSAKKINRNAYNKKKGKWNLMSDVQFSEMLETYLSEPPILDFNF